MNCTRCNTSHSPGNQLVSTNHGLLCDACLKALEAMPIETSLGTMLLAEGGEIVIDPVYNPYAELGPKTHYFDDALKCLTRPIIDEKPYVSLSIGALTSEDLYESIKRAIEKQNKILITGE